ncbi:hypothetical protein LTR66_014999 [Elasticomyces elasticus]|nr:hypothetical protein LTR66_014999 [Elasticomyces elasticus]
MRTEESDKGSECATRCVNDFYTRKQQKAEYDSLLQKLKDNAIYLHTLCQQVTDYKAAADKALTETFNHDLEECSIRKEESEKYSELMQHLNKHATYMKNTEKHVRELRDETDKARTREQY